jgi:hypothetical protein
MIRTWPPAGRNGGRGSSIVNVLHLEVSHHFQQLTRQVIVGALPGVTSGSREVSDRGSRRSKFKWAYDWASTLPATE